MGSAFAAEVTVRRRRYGNEENGWAVLEASGPDGTLTLVGPLIHLEPGERAEIVGEWVTDSRFGEQVKVAAATPLPPDSPDALAMLLQRVRHIGAKRADALIDVFGEARLLDELDRDPAGCFARVGLSSVRAAEAAEAWRELRGLRRLHLMLVPHGLGYLVTRIAAAYGEHAPERVREDPYALTSLFGVGFALADRIAGSIGAGNPEGRAEAAVVHTLVAAERDGSTCLPTGAALAGAAELLGETPPQGALQALQERGRVVEDEGFTYRRETWELEVELAERLAERSQHEGSEHEPALNGRLTTALSRWRDESPEELTVGELTDEQRGAVERALSCRLSLITGGPGTGKTSTIRAIVAAAKATGRADVLLLAPTGRAAARMTEVSSTRATTVHSALAWIPGEGPVHDEDDPVKCDLLILDETSMANLELLVTLLRAVPGTAHVVLVGDADQLAPVGAGKPFAELVESAHLPITRLTHIFRQAAKSMIVQGAHAIRTGSVPRFQAGEDMRRDLFMLERQDPAAACAEITELVAERLPRHYDIDPVRDIQVFSPVYRGELGIDALNAALRQALNPDGRKVRGGRLRVGDKLMMTGRNLHELGLMNGTMLRLLDETGEDDDGGGALLLAADDEGVFRLPHGESEGLRLGYACSVHRGQGIELPVAVIVAHPAAGAYFLRREMLYTAITRASLATIIVGTHQTVARAVASTDTGRRHGRLGHRLAGGA